ncbi:MAG: hypothetical protein HY094_00055 [Candidatus Melainabacteria bacterium]|nr:hypothetical protein [Candidatus Melainabacteria bacterium]
MKRVERLFLVSIIGFFLSFNNFLLAEEIKYSFGPVCKNGEVICPDKNEKAVCFSTDTRIHLTKIIINGEIKNQYQPSCGTYNNNLIPMCIDEARPDEQVPSHIVIGCVEFPTCTIKENNKLVSVCSDGKLPTCLGDDDEPNCDPDANSVCKKGVAVCDYNWQASAYSPSYQ